MRHEGARTAPGVARLVVGIDVEMRPPQGRSLLARFEAGEIGKDAHRVEDAHASLLAWLESEGGKAFSPLRPFVIGEPHGPREPWRVALGASVLEVPMGSQGMAAVPLDDLQRRAGFVAGSLGEIGMQVALDVFLVASPASSPRRVRAIVGVDVEAPSGKDGASLLERYRGGELEGMQEDADGTLDALVEWLCMEVRVPRFGGFGPTGPGGRHKRAVAGIALLQVDGTAEARGMGTPLAHVEQEAQRAHAALGRLGAFRPPAVHLVVSSPGA